MKSGLRHFINSFLSLMGKNGLGIFFKLVNSAFWLNNKTKRKLLSLPAKDAYECVVDLGFCEFEYSTFPQDDLQLATRSHLNSWEPKTLELFFNFSKNARTVIDVGGYTGVYSIIAAKANQESLIHVFEPFPQTAAKLRRNIELNNLSERVFIHEMALSEGSDLIYANFTKPDSLASTNSVTRLRDSKSKRVHHCSLDSLRIRNVDLIKIDVEGFENEVILGANETIRKYKPVIIMECLDDSDLEQIEIRLLKLGYNIPRRLGDSNGDEKNVVFIPG